MSVPDPAQPAPFPDPVTVTHAVRAHGVTSRLVHGWVRAKRLAFQRVRGHGAGGYVLLVPAAAVGALVGEYRAKLAAGPKHVNSRTCRKGLEPDAVTDAVSACDAVAGTLLERGLVLTPGDYAELARRREMFEARHGRCAA